MGPEKDTKMSKSLPLLAGCGPSFSFKKSLHRKRSLKELYKFLFSCSFITSRSYESFDTLKITRCLSSWNLYSRVCVCGGGADNQQVSKICVLEENKAGGSIRSSWHGYVISKSVFEGRVSEGEVK